MKILNGENKDNQWDLAVLYFQTRPIVKPSPIGVYAIGYVPT
jgi:hypothetical protein